MHLIVSENVTPFGSICLSNYCHFKVISLCFTSRSQRYVSLRGHEAMFSFFFTTTIYLIGSTIVWGLLMEIPEGLILPYYSSWICHWRLKITGVELLTIWKWVRLGNPGDVLPTLGHNSLLYLGLASWCSYNYVRISQKS